MKATRIPASRADEAGSHPCRGTLAKRACRAGSRGLNVVEAGIVLTILAITTLGATWLVFPEFRKSHIIAAALSCKEIKQAARSHVERELKEGKPEHCPTVQDLVNARKLETTKADDVWGMPYRISCVDGDILVTSAGRDRAFDTPDDIKHDFRPSDIERVMRL